jgi:ArsR family transcriptional regulator
MPRKQPVTARRAGKAVDTLKVLSSKTRFQILSLLLNAGYNPCVNDIAQTVGISHSATSHQLAKLEDKGIVTSFRRGQTICYHVKESKLTKQLRDIINQFSDDRYH